MIVIENSLGQDRFPTMTQESMLAFLLFPLRMAKLVVTVHLAIYSCPVAALGLGFVMSPSQSQELASDQIEEEAVDYYEKWLKETVVYIITEDEEKIFSGLTTDEEKEEFIEQFWLRRDPDLSTSINEFKEEHYRRIAYANQWFKSGKQGWLTDRGRIYIVHGPPSSIESHPAGGTYQRPEWEGGGYTSTFPFEIWTYRHIDGVGDDVELEFVDPVGGGEYRLSVNPDEKDALLNVPGIGLTRAERLGLASKSNRLPPTFNTLREKDNPFNRYETYARVQAPVELKYKELKELVDVELEYESFPLQVRKDYIKLNDSQVLVPITVEVENGELTYKFDGEFHVARVAVYGSVVSISKRLVTEFEDDLISAYSPARLQSGLAARSLYQKIVPLDIRDRYKLTLVFKDIESGKVGTASTVIAPPVFPTQRLSASSLILSSHIEKVREPANGDMMFVVGDLKIHPNIDNRFITGSPIGVYLQLYTVGLDSASLKPSLTVRYILTRDGESVAQLQDEGEEAVYSFSHRRVVLIKALPVSSLSPGKYLLQVEVSDRIKEEDLTVTGEFEIEPNN